ncbi:unnamed protein product [Angiostrongylus costaricensis]|uniref:START domain-containing protein n=1 Tax=Angiostrongylus costaricensis TaxID=334426 RepID=A0A0R3PRE8_ANGCS|nr:unnamed protein product [Angiostrongylus costaricensis]
MDFKGDSNMVDVLKQFLAWHVRTLPWRPEDLQHLPMIFDFRIEMAPPDDRTAFPPVHTGDEVVVLAYPQYRTAIVQSVFFTTPPPVGGFLHVMTIIDPLNKPFAIFFTYNLPSTGVLRLPVPTVLQGMTGRATYIDNKTAAKQKS